MGYVVFLDPYLSRIGGVWSNFRRSTGITERNQENSRHINVGDAYLQCLEQNLPGEPYRFIPNFLPQMTQWVFFLNLNMTSPFHCTKERAYYSVVPDVRGKEKLQSVEKLKGGHWGRPRWFSCDLHGRSGLSSQAGRCR